MKLNKKLFLGVAAAAVFVFAFASLTPHAYFFNNLWNYFVSSPIQVAGAEPCGDAVEDRQCRFLRSSPNDPPPDCPVNSGYTGKCDVKYPQGPWLIGTCEKRSCSNRQWIEGYCEIRRRSQSECGLAGAINVTYRCSNSAYGADNCEVPRSTWHDSVTIGTGCENVRGNPSGVSLTPTGPSMSMCVVGGYCNDPAYLLDQSGCTALRGTRIEEKSCSISSRSVSECDTTAVWHAANCSDGSNKSESECKSTSSSTTTTSNGSRNAMYCIGGFCVSSWGSEESATIPGGRMCINSSCISYGPVDGKWSTVDYGDCSAVCEGGTQPARCIPPRNGGRDCQGPAPTRRCNEQVCPDSDGDGYKDRNDSCPNQGTCATCSSFGACPQGVPAGGYLYSYPSCTLRSNGCIDTDGDGLVDSSDSCPVHAQGSGGRGGCPKPQAYGPSISGYVLGSTSFSESCGSWAGTWQLKFGVKNYKSYTVKYNDNDELIISETCSGSACTNGYDNVAGYSNRAKYINLDKSRKVRVDVISASGQTDTEYSQCILPSTYEKFDSWNVGDINKAGGNTCDSNAVDAYTCNGTEERTCNDVKGCWWGTDDRWRYGGDNRDKQYCGVNADFRKAYCHNQNP